MLLAPFTVETLAEQHATALAEVSGQYGRTWARGVVDGWFGPVNHFAGADRETWIGALPGLCTALRAAGADPTATLLAEGAWRWTEEQLNAWLGLGREKDRRPQLERLGTQLAHVLQAAGPQSADTIATALRGLPDTMLESLLPALRTAAPRTTTVRDDAPAARAFQALADHCEDRLTKALARPVR
ncbi:MAG: hypothetical protein ACRDPR_23695, partial [Nocardioidaceae bacterium]